MMPQHDLQNQIMMAMAMATAMLSHCLTGWLFFQKKIKQDFSIFHLLLLFSHCRESPSLLSGNHQWLYSLGCESSILLWVASTNNTLKQVYCSGIESWGGYAKVLYKEMKIPEGYKAIWCIRTNKISCQENMDEKRSNFGAAI